MRKIQAWISQNVGKELPNLKFASAYVQAYRIADKVGIQAKGDNKFLDAGDSIIVGSETISSSLKMVLNERISAPYN
jgi:hypothetical protein